MVKLFYAVIGDAWDFLVHIDLHETVADLKRMIKADNPNRIRCDAAEMALYLARCGDEWWRMDDGGESLKALKNWESNDEIQTIMGNEMETTRRLNEYFGEQFEWRSGEINVLIKLPKANKRRYEALDVPGGSARWLADFPRSFVRSRYLPASDELPDFVMEPLPTKIGLSEETFDRVRLLVGEEACAKVFAVDDRTPCDDLWAAYFQGAIYPADWRGGVAAGFLGFWRAIVSRLVSRVFHLQRDVVFCDATVMSVSTTASEPTGTLLELRDIGFLCDKEHEEEKSEEEAKAPTTESRDRVVWSYGDNTPYVFCYSAVGSRCTLFAASAWYGITVMAKEIGVYDTKRPAERLHLLRAVLQLSRLFGGLADLCPRQAFVPRPFFSPTGLSTIVLMHDLSFADAPGVGAWTEMDQPLVDVLSQVRCLTFYEGWTGSDACKPRTMPCGTPVTIDALFDAIEYVLTILVDLHKCGWMHRNLRWAIVVKDVDPAKGWSLIDFKDAVPSPQRFPSGTHLTQGVHAPEMFRQAGWYTTAVDVWGVGYLIHVWNLRSQTTNEWTVSTSRLLFLRQLLSCDPTKRPTAKEALETLKVLRREYERETTGRTAS